MCPAIHTKSRSWLRSSSTREPSDPLLRVVFQFHSDRDFSLSFFCERVYQVSSPREGRGRRKLFFSVNSRTLVRHPFLRGRGLLREPRERDTAECGPSRRDLLAREPSSSLASEDTPFRRLRCGEQAPPGFWSAFCVRVNCPSTCRSGREGRGRHAVRDDPDSEWLLITTPGGDADGNDPSAGSPTETLLRLLLPLNDQVWITFRLWVVVADLPKPVRKPH